MAFGPRSLRGRGQPAALQRLKSTTAISALALYLSANASTPLDFTQGAVPSGLTGTGPAGTVRNASGLVVPASGARLDYGSKVTNLLLQSNAFGTAPWTIATAGGLAAPTLSTISGGAPDGISNATQITFPATTGNNQQSCVQQIISGLIPGAPYTYSVFAQGTTGGERVFLGVQANATGYALAGQSAVPGTASWERWSVTFTAPSASVYLYIGNNTTVSGSGQVNGAGGTLRFFQAQLTVGATMRSALVTTTNATASKAPTSALLIESRTKLLPWSNDFTKSVWTKNNVTPTPNAGTAPDGTSTATQFVFSQSTGAQQSTVQQLISGLTVGQTYVVGVWALGAAGGEDIYLQVQRGVSPYDTFSWSRIAPSASDWSYYQIPFVAQSTSVYFGIGTNTSVAGPPTTQYGGTVYLWNANLEIGAVATSDVITGSAPVTLADVNTVTVPSGADTLIVTFADGTLQYLPVSPGSYTLPTDLAGTRIAKIAAATTLSKPITGLTFGTPLKYNSQYPLKYIGSDTFGSTWADDDQIYTVHDDSYGWQNAGPTSNLAFSKFSSAKLPLTGSLVNAMAGFGTLGQLGSDNANWKAWSAISIGGVLYATVSRNTYGTAGTNWIQTSTNSQIIKSIDKGATWTPQPPSTGAAYASPMFPGSRFGSPYFIQFGKDYRHNGVHNADTYVYAISNDGTWDNGNSLVLGRCKISDMAALDATKWSFYLGGDGMVDANWGALGSAALILSNPLKLSAAAIQYLPAIKRYLMLEWYYPAVANSTGSNGTNDTIWDVYEAPAPWGPWSKVQSIEFTPSGLYGGAVIPKSISVDGGKSLVVAAAGDFNNQDRQTGNYTLTLLNIGVNT